MIAKYLQKGECLDYTPTTAVSAGAVVVQGLLVGVAKLDIAAGTLGGIATTGVFVVAKAAEAIAVGDVLYWDATNSVVTKTKGSLTTIFGKAVTAAVAGDATVNALLNG